MGVSMREFLSKIVLIFVVAQLCVADTRLRTAASDPIDRPKTVLAIGDSISLGEGALGLSVNCALNDESNSLEASFASSVAVNLNAELEVWAWSGHGLTRNYDDFKSPTIATRAEAKLDLARSLDFDLVLLHVGTNDFHQYDASEQFIVSYRVLLERLSKAFPNAALVALSGPMLAPADRARFRDAVDEAVRAHNATRQEGLVQTLHFSESLAPEQPFGCAWHPSQIMHEAMARDILGILQNEF